MKKWIAAVLFLAVVGCTGGEDDRIYELTTGTYAVSGIEVEIDGCQFTPEDGTLAVTVDGENLSFGIFQIVMDGNSLSGGGETILEEPSIDCVLDVTGTATGKKTGDDAFRLSEEVVLTVNSGTECNDIGLTFPCSTEFSFHAKK